MGTTFVLGASRGIGWALSQQALAAGERVIATARDDAALARLRAAGAIALGVDVADPASVSGLAWHLDGEKIDTAWHVAGVMCSRANAAQPPTREQFDRVMHTNVLGAMQVIPQIAPLVQAAGGRYAFLSSAMGLIGGVSGSGAWLYRVSKAALNMAVASAHTAYPGATFICLHPGWVQTEMGGQSAPVSVADSVQGMRQVVAHQAPDGGVRFLHHDGTLAASW